MFILRKRSGVGSLLRLFQPSNKKKKKRKTSENLDLHRTYKAVTRLFVFEGDTMCLSDSLSTLDVDPFDDSLDD